MIEVLFLKNNNKILIYTKVLYIPYIFVANGEGNGVEIA